MTFRVLFLAFAVVAYILVDLFVVNGPLARAIIRVLKWRLEYRWLRMQATCIGLTTGRWESRRSLRERIRKAIQAPIFRGTKREYQELVASLLGIEPRDVGVERPERGTVHLIVPRRISQRSITKVQGYLREYTLVGTTVLVVRRAS